MELMQVSIFGECKPVVVKYTQENKPRKLSKKNRKLKQKLEILYKLYEQLYEKQNISLLDSREIIIKNNIIIYPEDRQAEPINIINLNILTDIDKKINKMKEILNVI